MKGRKQSIKAIYLFKISISIHYAVIMEVYHRKTKLFNKMNSYCCVTSGVSDWQWLHWLHVPRQCSMAPAGLTWPRQCNMARQFLHGPGSATWPQQCLHGPSSGYMALVVVSWPWQWLHGPSSAYMPQAVLTPCLLNFK